MGLWSGSPSLGEKSRKVVKLRLFSRLLGVLGSTRAVRQPGRNLGQRGSWTVVTLRSESASLLGLTGLTMQLLTVLPTPRPTAPLLQVTPEPPVNQHSHWSAQLAEVEGMVPSRQLSLF